MQTRRKFIKNTGLLSAGLLAIQSEVFASESNIFNFSMNDFVSKRPPLAERKFTSKAIEAAIDQIKKQIANLEAEAEKNTQAAAANMDAAASTRLSELAEKNKNGKEIRKMVYLSNKR